MARPEPLQYAMMPVTVNQPFAPEAKPISIARVRGKFLASDSQPNSPMMLPLRTWLEIGERRPL